jgi:hypothetical protein
MGSHIVNMTEMYFSDFESFFFADRNMYTRFSQINVAVFDGIMTDYCECLISTAGCPV